jgi:alpha-glucosidase
MTKETEGPRDHAQAQVGPLAAAPFDGDGIREVRIFRVRTTASVEHGATITALVPTTEDGDTPAEPSLVLAHAPERVAAGLASDEERRRWEHDGAVVRVQVPFPPGTSFYGTGEVAGPLLRNGRATTLWNTDAWCYGEETPSLYQSHPCVLALLADGRAVGLLADSFRRGAIQCASDGVEMQFEEEPFALYRIEAESPAEVIRALAALVGTIEMPPLWALGYHQSRWSYGDEAEVRALAKEFRTRKIPCDGLWLDIDYMERFRIFSVDPRRFADLEALTEDLRLQGFHTVAILDPGIAADRGDGVCSSGLEGDHFVRDARGKPAKGRVWPGACHFPDFTRGETHAWWAERVRAFLDATGIDGLWNDMNEPSIFKTPARTLPDAARHQGLGGGTHARFHNLYGRLMAQATREGMERARPELRPFVLTRSNHLGGARFAATWTGDNQSRWEDLRWSIPMVLNLGLSGQPFSGPDVGGFHGDPAPELFARWFELASLLPFFRGHSEKEACRKEPWSFGPAIEVHVRAAIERRMRLLPYLYTAFREAHESGLPVARPVFFADPADPELRAVEDAFLLGGDLLVAPVVRQGATRRTAILPKHEGGGWYVFPDGERRLDARKVALPAPLGTLPLLVRAGSIVPTIEARESTRGGFGPILTLHVFLDRRGTARGRLYEDAGDGHGHRRGEFRDARFAARLVHGEVRLESEIQGSWALPARETRVVAHGKLS